MRCIPFVLKTVEITYQKGPFLYGPFCKKSGDRNLNIFVASWFFPPATSSEGIVTYKLLRNSKHDYDVVSSSSKQWGYKADMSQREEKNIHCWPVETDDIDVWADACVEQFEKRYKEKKYECVMTRSTPPESILVGLKIKKAHPEVKWIASLADPVANNPYELKAYVDDCTTLSAAQKQQIRVALSGTNEEQLAKWEKRPEEGVKLLCKLKRWENSVIKNADLIISPSGRQLRYLLGEREWNAKCFAVPHSYDPSFYTNAQKKTDKVVMSFIGYSDPIRSLEPFIKAVKQLKEDNSPFLNRLEMRFIGNNPRYLQDMVMNFYLDDVIHFEKGVNYYQSLDRMQESDWLLHVDAFFPELSPGGSIFFAGKLADYLGAGRPIFALTGSESPADKIVRKAGGVSVLQFEIDKIADALEEILCGTLKPELKPEYIEQYSAPVVAARFDERVDQLCTKTWTPQYESWPVLPEAHQEKLVTICVPSYNVQRYLERGLRSLLDHKYAAEIEVLVVDDGSVDCTSQIAAEFEKHYPGIVRLIKKPNGGHGSTINRAIKEGTGRYFMVVDADDWIDSAQFEKLLDKIKEGTINTDIISSNYHEVDMGSGQCSPWEQQAKIQYFKAQKFDEIDVEHVYFTLASSLIKLQILKDLNMPLQEHTFYVDVEYILFPVPRLNTVMFVDYYIYKYCRGNSEQSVHIPTMINRYDHHERVMKRVLQYEKDTEMTLAQKKYYDAILRRLLYTHYSLCLAYDTDLERGCSRAKEFDQFMKQVNPELAQWIGKEMPILRVARRTGFNAARVKRSSRLKCRRFIKGKIFKMKPLAKKILYNRVTIKIGKSNFFENGFGHKIKEKARKLMGFQ